MTAQMDQEKRTAVEAVAKWFSATLGRSSHDVFLVVAGKRVDLHTAILKGHGIAKGDHAIFRLRFDKVATRLMDRLRAALVKMEPDGTSVVVTVTAPIRLPSKTAALLESKLQALLLRGSRDERDTIHGNSVRIRVLRDEAKHAPKVIGFVHNPDSDPSLLLNMTRNLLELISAKAGRGAPRLTNDRWLVVISAGDISCLEVYRSIYSQLCMATDFKKILMVFDDGRVGILEE